MQLEEKLSSLFEAGAQVEHPQTKALFIELFNIVEELLLRNKMLEEENRQLRDEINRLKGEHGAPHIKANTRNKNISSEKERRQEKEWKKEAKKPHIPIDNTVACTIGKDKLPADAQFKYRETVIGQDILFKRNNTLYVIDVYYSPSEKKTYRAPLPADYSGYHGNGLKSFALTLHNVCDVTSHKILSLFHSIGIEISAGSLSSILLGNNEWLLQEKNDILHAGLEVSYAQVDATASRVRGENHHTQIICNDYFTCYTTLKNKSRLDVLAAFQGLHDKNRLQVIYNEETIRLLETAKVPEDDQKLLAEMFEHSTAVVSLENFEKRIQTAAIELYNKPVIFTRVKEAFAFAYYHYQDEFPVVQLLMSDDAPEYNDIATVFHVLCWIHDARFYKKLTPMIKGHQQTCTDFMKRYWDYYHSLLAYKKQAQNQAAQKLTMKFDQLFVPDTDYAQLNQCIKRTVKNKEHLLGVLTYPQLPLHNNSSELGARQKARKRDISLHTMTDKGTQVQDAWMTIVQTAIKLGVNIYDYIRGKINNENSETSSLAKTIYQKARFAES